MAHYFNKDTTKSIIKMQNETNIPERNRIFVEEIQPAFEKLVSFHYGRLPDSMSKNDELKQDALTDLFEKIHNFKSDKYERGFPYFNVICRNFFYQEMTRQEKERNFSRTVTSLSEIEGSSNEPIYEDLESTIENQEFMNLFKENLDRWHDQFKKPQEKEFIEALAIVFDNAKNMEFHNKKAIYIYLRELTGLNSKQIATNLAKIKKKFINFKKKWDKGDI